MNYKYIFWDWNGTLSNDAEAAYYAVNDMLIARKLPTISFEQYKEYVDVPIIRFYEKVMDMSKEDMDDISIEFNTLWSKHLKGCLLMDGAVELLDKLSEMGVKQFIFSSSHTDFIVPTLEKYDILKYFTAVLGAQDRYVGSKTERTKKYFLENGIPLEQAVFIGDMVHDCQVADAIGADCILISCGHQPCSVLKASGKKVFSTFSELSHYLLS